jgi:hypothetical protein
MVSVDYKLKRKEFHWLKNEIESMPDALDGDGLCLRRSELLPRCERSQLSDFFLVSTSTIQVTEACRMLKPLPHLEDGDNCQDEASSDSEDDNSGAVGSVDDKDDQLKFFAEKFETFMPLSSHTVRSYTCNQLRSELIIMKSTAKIDRMDCTMSTGAVAQNSASFTNPAAAIDIMECEADNQYYSQQACNKQPNFFPVNDSPSLKNYKSVTSYSDILIDDLIMYLASISPTVLVRDPFLSFTYRIVLLRLKFLHVFLKFIKPCFTSQYARRSYHGSPQSSHRNQNTAAANEFDGYRCQRIQIEVCNFNGGSSMPREIIKPSEFFLSTEVDTHEFLPIAVISEARHELFNLLEELQEGLVVKLLLPTEPTTPSLMSDMLGNRGTSTGDCRVNFEANLELDCWQETRPLQQRVKKLYMFNESNHFYEAIKSPDSVAHFDDSLYSLEQSSINNRYCIPKSDQNYDLSTRIDARYTPHPRVAVFPNTFDQDSLIGNSLQPISPICSREDVTSVQLLHLRVYLDPHLEINQKSFDTNTGTKSCGISLVIEYGIKTPDSQKTKPGSQNYCDQEDESFTFGSVAIKSVPYLPRIDGYPLTATISTSSNISRLKFEINPVNFNFSIFLDYDFILSELMRIISFELRRAPLS